MAPPFISNHSMIISSIPFLHALHWSLRSTLEDGGRWIQRLDTDGMSVSSWQQALRIWCLQTLKRPFVAILFDIYATTLHFIMAELLLLKPASMKFNPFHSMVYKCRTIRRLDYCHSTLAGLPKFRTHKFQSILNCVTRLVPSLVNFSHVANGAQDKLNYFLSKKELSSRSSSSSEHLWSAPFQHTFRSFLQQFQLSWHTNRFIQHLPVKGVFWSLTAVHQHENTVHSDTKT